MATAIQKVQPGDGQFAIMRPLSPIAQEALERNLKGVDVDLTLFPRVKLPAGGATVWSFTLGAEDIVVKQLDVLILDYKRYRVYWEEEFSGESTPPTCVSDDCIHGSVYGRCRECPQNSWNSGKNGVGKACQERMLLLAFPPQARMPILINLPVTSVKPFQQFCVGLLNGIEANGYEPLPVGAVVTRLELERAKSGGGIDYAKIKPSVARVLTPEEFDTFKRRTAPFMAILEGISATDAAGMGDEDEQDEDPSSGSSTAED